ncbi:hypothetical protein RYX36_015221, partial [Vicia faba]
MQLSKRVHQPTCVLESIPSFTFNFPGTEDSNKDPVNVAFLDLRRFLVLPLQELFKSAIAIPWINAFWPSIVMKKWLNIKPKVNDFSEDEVDTETESKDD